MTPDGFEILYEQGPVLAVLKPAGVLTQAPPGIDSLELRIKRFLKAREEKPGNVYLAVIHRLDRPVSGVMLFCKHVRAARKLSEQFEDRMVKKIYWAYVAGTPTEPAGTWTDYLRKIPGEPRSEIVDRAHPEGQLAILHYRTLTSSDQGSLLEIELETGRTHQIRLQSSAHGHPVWGDALYGSTVTFGPTTDDERARVIALHARSIAFRHPMTQEPVALTAPLPAYWPTETPQA
ncbi:MAG TPA: RluA family pseudouridine synthase [Pirellulaceae bacterium]|nr:RluA family pseudouridine synthase [Pirellulaceae bacterium]